MPKKRHFNRYSKPQSTAPASLASSSAEPSSRQVRGVNELLANLRRTSISPHQRVDHPVAAPSVHPAIREILQLPETPAPPPRGPRNRYRLDARGRRLPAGPPPPRSWQAVTAPRHDDDDEITPGVGRRASTLPGDYVPATGSLVDMILRALVKEWPALAPHEDLGLWALPDGIRQALLRHLDVQSAGNVSLADLRAILVPDGDGDVVRMANAYFTHLHVPPALLTTSAFPSLVGVLFPKPSAKGGAHSGGEEPQESWEAAEALAPRPPRHLLPALTHLSLAVDPSARSAGGGGAASAPSWRVLLQLAKRLPGLTHLSLAFWPAPTRTPNAKLASVVGPQGNAVQYGGTGFYSHSLDGDWSEAVNILRALSRRLYQLEYLDLTGCGQWLPALVLGEESAVDGDEERLTREGGVDWVGDWGQVVFVGMRSGLGEAEGPLGEKERETYRAGVEAAGVLERHVTAQRAGKGRIITVDKDDLYALR